VGGGLELICFPQTGTERTIERKGGKERRSERRGFDCVVRYEMRGKKDREPCLGNLRER